MLADISKFVPTERILTDPAELLVYEMDGFTIAKARPGAVIFALSTEEVVKIVRALNRQNVQIVPRGTGTGLTGGCVAFENGVVISTSKMNRVLAVDLPNRVAQVEAGVRNTQLTDALTQIPGGSEFHFSPDPSSQRASTIGGNAATNAGGIHVLKDFVTSNHILGLEMVLADGTVLNCGSHDGAYESGNFDLPGLICGCEGTFGIITKLWVRLSPRPRSFRTIVSVFAESQNACNNVAEVIATGMLPSAMEMMDGLMVKVIEDAFHFGVPANTKALVLTEIDGPAELLDQQAQKIAEIAKKHKAISVEVSADPDRRSALWKMRKSAFGAIGRISPSYCTQDACVPRSKLPQVLAKIDEIGKRYGLTIPNVFHAGDGNVHPIFLYDDRDEKQVHNVLEAAEDILKHCVDVGGTISGEHGIGVEKIHLMSYQFDKNTMDQFQRVKRAFDSEERINAGKLIPSEKVKVNLLHPGRKAPQ
ncbi:MAG TPA: FAD-linked oxidase C-terminal domain-containing protein [Tepidisphaeraceae bacterium]|jgi:glycolate oxidase